MGIDWTNMFLVLLFGRFLAILGLTKVPFGGLCFIFLGFFLANPRRFSYLASKILRTSKTRLIWIGKRKL